MNALKPLITILSTVMISTTVYAVDIYECTDPQSKHKTFQDKVCSDGHEQIVRQYDVSDKAPDDMLRPYELVMLERFHEMDTERLKSRLELEKEYRLAQQQYENMAAFEKLRHQQAIEMFDKHYRHFWAYSYSNGAADNPFSFGPSSDTIIDPVAVVPAPPLSTPPANPTPGPTVPGTR